MSRKEFVDRYLAKGISKKLTVFLIGSIALFTGKLTGTDWVIVSAVYIGSQTAVDIYEKLLKSKSGNVYDGSGTTY